jgi:hypothetical protein
MTESVLVNIWKKYPGSHLHCDVTQTGIYAYHVVASLISHDGDEIIAVAHSGQGDLNTIKDQAFRLLASEIFTPVKI